MINIAILALTIIALYAGSQLILMALKHKVYGVWYERIFLIGVFFIFSMLIANNMGENATHIAAKSFFIYIDCVIAFTLITMFHALYAKLKSKKHAI